MKKVKLNKILKNGKAIFLAYDQGLEHGPTDFNDKNVDPKYIIDIAKKGKLNALIFQKGVVGKYQKEIKKSKIPLILKLNGKTKIRKGEPFSPLICTVDEAIDLGADAVGYTIYIGSEYESKMFEEFEKIEQEAHAKSLPVVAWIYPRGKNVKNDTSKEMISYAARVGLELGADIVKIKYGGNPRDLKWAVKSAGKTKVMISGGTKKSEIDFLRQIKDIMKTGAIGMAIGRNIWQNPKPLEIIKKIQKIIWE
ncbi:MAG: fructose-bisphosphate aldolase [Nanoarchaeota archaeon]|nr:fructose-bisphosphate aldolase [Nanoarchaeota archaeon]